MNIRSDISRSFSGPVQENTRGLMFCPDIIRAGGIISKVTYSIKCSKCSRTSSWETVKTFDDSRVSNRFRNLGWVLGKKRTDDVCPSCLHGVESHDSPIGNHVFLTADLVPHGMRSEAARMSSKKSGGSGVERVFQSRRVNRFTPVSSERQKAESAAEQLFKPKMPGDGPQPSVDPLEDHKLSGSVSQNQDGSFLHKSAENAERAIAAETREMQRELNNSVSAVAESMKLLAQSSEDKQRQIDTMAQMMTDHVKMVGDILARQAALGDKMLEQFMKMNAILSESRAESRGILAGQISDQVKQISQMVGTDGRQVANQIIDLLDSHARSEILAGGPRLIDFSQLGGETGTAGEVLVDSASVVDGPGEGRKRRKRRTPAEMEAARAELARLRSLGMVRGRGRPRKDAQAVVSGDGISGEVGRDEKPVVSDADFSDEKSTDSAPVVSAYSSSRRGRPRKIEVLDPESVKGDDTVPVTSIEEANERKGRGRPRKIVGAIQTVGTPILGDDVIWDDIAVSGGVMVYSTPSVNNSGKFITHIQVERWVWDSCNLPTRASTAIYGDFDGEVLIIGRKGTQLGRIKGISSTGVTVQFPYFGELNFRGIKTVILSGALAMKGDLIR